MYSNNVVFVVLQFLVAFNDKHFPPVQDYYRGLDMTHSAELGWKGWTANTIMYTAETANRHDDGINGINSLIDC